MKKQAGFLMAQLGISLLITVLVTTYLSKLYWDNATREAQDNRAKLVGTMLATLNDATKTYSTQYFTQIQLGQAISAHGFTLPAARVLHPTPQDLHDLGFLRAEAVQPVRYGEQMIGFDIQFTLHPTGCVAPNCNLNFLVRTTTPLLDARNDNRVDIRRITLAANAASTGNAGVSLDDNPNVFVAHDGNVIGPNDTHTVGLVAIRNGYDSQGFAEFVRRDGSVPMTGDLNFKDASGTLHNINNVNAVNAVSTVTRTLQVTDLATEGQPCSKRGLIASDAKGKLLGCDGSKWGKATTLPSSYRYLFTASTKWTVPKGVKSSFVTMAGGGGTGAGWRISNAYATGHSGGYVFNQPVNLVEDEVLDVVIGQGAKGIGLMDLGVAADPAVRIWGPPNNDNGLGGYPGTASKLISPTLGTLLECDGGSGAVLGGLYDFDGSPVAGGLKGALVGSAHPKYPTTSRPALGPYTRTDSPGACGNADYGIGNRGISSWSVASGNYRGGTTPFGYGSGGDVSISGCYVTYSTGGTCIWTGAARDGVVIIDVMY